jgi:hypothetical protein
VIAVLIQFFFREKHAVAAYGKKHLGIGVDVDDQEPFCHHQPFQ